MLGPFVAMVSANHTFVNGSARFGPPSPGPIRIGAGSWIAAHASVMAGVTVGRSCLVAAGAVVTRSIPDHAIVGGVPARLIGTTSQSVQVRGLEA
jgi:maltose O-acetyltransferase